jgi:hypothetical protein
VDNKLKKILETLNAQIDSKELSAALKADSFDGEYALSDDGITAIVDQTKGLLTIDGAKHSPDIAEYFANDLYPKHKKSATAFIEQKLKPIFDKLKIDYSSKEFVSDALEDLDPVLESLLEKSSKGGSDSNEVIESLKADLRKAHEELQGKDEHWTKTLEEKESEYKISSLKKEYYLKANQYNWADAYKDPDLQQAILDKKWDKLNAKAHLSLADDGTIKLYQKDMPDKELYEGNKIQTFQNLLEPEIEAYLKKSNPVQETNAQQVQGSSLTPEQQQNRDMYLAQKEEYARSMR